PQRTEGEALMRALDVASRAGSDPARFEELALQYSDDIATRSLGGALGGVRAGQLPGEFLDALAVLKPGQVSRVVGTPFGYHVLKRRPMPADETVCGRRAIVRYDGAVVGSATASSVRSRDEAKRLSEQLAASVQAG